MASLFDRMMFESEKRDANYFLENFDSILNNKVSISIFAV